MLKIHNSHIEYYVVTCHLFLQNKKTNQNPDTELFSWVKCREGNTEGIRTPNLGVTYTVYGMDCTYRKKQHHMSRYLMAIPILDFWN